MFEIDPDDQKKLDNLFTQLTGDKKPLMTNISAALMADFKLGFRLSRDPGGSSWLPIKHRQGQPLRDTDRLRDSLTEVITSNSVEIGTNVEYAARHQFGFEGVVGVKSHLRKITKAWGKPLTGGPKKIQVKSHTKKMKTNARPFLGFTKRQVDIVRREIKKHFVKVGLDA